MGLEFGRTVKDRYTRDHFLITKRTDMVNIVGQIAENHSKVNSKME